MINCCKTLAILVVLWYNSIVNEWYTFTTNTNTKGQQKMKQTKANYYRIELPNLIVVIDCNGLSQTIASGILSTALDCQNKIRQAPKESSKLIVSGLAKAIYKVVAYDNANANFTQEQNADNTTSWYIDIDNNFIVAVHTTRSTEGIDE